MDTAPTIKGIYTETELNDFSAILLKLYIKPPNPSVDNRTENKSIAGFVIVDTLSICLSPIITKAT